MVAESVYHGHSPGESQWCCHCEFTVFGGVIDAGGGTRIRPLRPSWDEQRLVRRVLVLVDRDRHRADSSHCWHGALSRSRGAERGGERLDGIAVDPASIGLNLAHPPVML